MYQDFTHFCIGQTSQQQHNKCGQCILSRMNLMNMPARENVQVVGTL